MSGRHQYSSSSSSSNHLGKIYVWVKLRGDGTSCISLQPQGSSNSTIIQSSKNSFRRLRTSSSTTTTTTNDALDNNLWRWTPGYYTCSSLASSTCADSLSTPSSSSSTTTTSSAATTTPLVEYHFTLFDQRTTESNHEQHTLPENKVSQYLENGDIVLANSWEIHDFAHRFGLVESDIDDYNNDDNNVSDVNIIHTTTVLDHRNHPSQPPHNLIELTHLHEPSVVNALRHRYYHRMRGEQSHDIHNVYTDTGPILLAVNPFQIAHDDDDDDVEKRKKEKRSSNTGGRNTRLSLYGENTMRRYKLDGEKRWIEEMSRMEHGREDDSDDTNHSSSSSSSTLPPHVYAVADRTFRTMLKRMHHHTSNSNAGAVAKHRAAAAAGGGGMRKESMEADNEKINQSILVSGESGAGKTVTTKLLMAYLSKLSKSGTDGGGDSSSSIRETDPSISSSINGAEMSVEKRILESNPILESFGNARTVRNDNSSRFGKYIEMKFLSSLPLSSSSIIIPNASLAGASIETYLLEKVRLVHQSAGERNYHIFYELFSMKYPGEMDNCDIAGRKEKEGFVEEEIVSLKELGLLDYDMEDFTMLNNSDTYDRRDGVSDHETFLATKHAMTIMEFTPSDVSNVLQVVAALLHASNLSFVQRADSVDQNGDDECELDVENPHLGHVVSLLGITVEKLNSAVCYHEITIGGDGGSGPGLNRGRNNKGGNETHQRILTREQAAKGVEALIKATYGAVFDYLVKRINSSVASSNLKCSNLFAAGRRQAAGRDRLVKESSIGILDIFGFESFQTNSFEQLCINYCNEALQQQFNRFVLKREQEEYNREGVPWSFIEYPENQDVLDLIDSKVSGILAILHDQCRTPRATDKSFALCVYEKCSKYSRFEADSRQMAEQLFAVHHYAGVVEYDVEGFVEKNRDELPKNALGLLQSSTIDFVRALAQILVPSPVTVSSQLSPSTKVKKTGVTQRPTVGVQFSSQLQDLRSKIDDTSPHYIRCLKPNTCFAPYHFDDALISNQLRCAGVIQAVQVSRLGYPHRLTHCQFVARYQILGGQSSSSMKKNNTAKTLVLFIKENQKYDHLGVGVQVGRSKVFLRHQAHELLEKLRREKIVSAAVTVQKTARKYACQKFKAKALCSLLRMQSFVRKVLAVMKVTNMRRLRNSIVIQKSWRKNVVRKRFLSVIFIVFWCQSHYRGIVGRKDFQQLKRDEMALYIQSRWRRQCALARFRKQRKAAILIQCALRCHKARSELVARKAESRNLSLLIQERDKLREESRVLRSELSKTQSELSKINCVNRVSKSCEAPSDSIDTEVLPLRLALEQRTKEREIAENELEVAKRKILELESERDKAIQDREELTQHNETLQAELDRCSLRATLDHLKNEKFLTEHNLEQGEENMTSRLRKSDAGDCELSPTDTHVTEFLFLRDALHQLALEKEVAEQSLEHANNDILALKSERDIVILDRDDLREVNKLLQSELSSCEDELCRVKKSLDEIMKQNAALSTSKCIGADYSRTPTKLMRANDDADNTPVDLGYNIPTTRSSVSEYSLAGNTLSEWEDESRIIRLENFTVQSDRSKRLSMYELDDMKRVNISLREDLEAITAQKNAIAKEFQEKCDEFNELNDDIEKFAEAFAAQQSEIQKLQFENKKLKKALTSSTVYSDKE